MKYIKILICVLLISLGLVFQGEEYESYINTVEELYPGIYLQYDTAEIDNKEAVIDDILNYSKKYNVSLFSEYNESKSNICNEKILYISDDNIKERLKKDNYITEGKFSGLLDDDFSVTYKSFDNLTDIRYFPTLSIMGAKEDVNSFAKALTEKYNFFRYADAEDRITNQEFEVYFIWLVVGLVILSLTIFEIVSRKKEFSVRWCFGYEREKTVAINIFTDIFIILGLYLVLCKFISFVTACTFMFTKTLMILSLVCAINSLLWISVLFFDIKDSIKGKEVNKGSVVIGVLTKIIVSCIGMILLSDCLISLMSFVSLSNQREFFEKNKNYTYMTVCFHTSESRAINDEHKRLEFYRSVFKKADVRIQININENHGIWENDVLYFNKNAENYLMENLKIENLKIEDRTLCTFIPEKYRDSVTDAQIDDIVHMAKFRTDSSKGLTYKYQTVYYSENVKLIAMNMTERKKTCDLYKNPIVVLNTTDESQNKNEITGDVNITNANSHIMYDLSKINLDEELSKIGFDPALDSVIKTNILDDYNYRYSSISHDFTLELIESCVAVFLIVLMQYIFIKSEMAYRAKELAIKSSLGYTKWEKYKFLILIDLLPLIISLAVGIEFGTAIHTEYKYILAAFALITAIDFISIVFFINKVEKAKVVRLIKGAAL
ncbi:MAG: hypothetical protein Q4A45_02450 [Clostridia bacterium]|nr:hypothetical protein [Clostridia bacterium]